MDKTQEMLDDLKSNFTTYKDRINEAQKEFRGIAREGLTNLLRELFDKYPFVKSVSFDAYTPYFNDGEECTYSVHHDYCSFNGFDEDGDEDEDGENVLGKSRQKIYQRGEDGKWVYVPNPNYDPLYEQAVNQFREALGVIDDDTWKTIIGDHVTVTITRDGFETTDYEHD
jgi:hypothetical protein